MKPIVFFDTEINPQSLKILDIGAVDMTGRIFHSSKIAGFVDFVKNEEYLCGHNVFLHDWKYLNKSFSGQEIEIIKLIDTLYLSPLLFPSKPYHRLLKDDKLQSFDLNNPVNDSKKAKDLYFDEVSAFSMLDEDLKSIFYLLLYNQREFQYFFEYISFETDKNIKLHALIKRYFKQKICKNAPIDKMIKHFPKELAYSLALINIPNNFSLTPPWVMKSYPEIERIMYLLRNKVCITGCEYCDDLLNADKALKRYFGYESYRKFEGRSLQKEVVESAINNNSLLAIFPTGGGKSITFQVPALIEAVNTRGLTVVISPLQSLMKDQVDNLEKSGITQAVTINGLLDPIERSNSFERVKSGAASILYISPESLRSRSIERLLLNRRIARFVIDEAHCLSSWGQDFRVDYLYIADFIKSLQEKKSLTFKIPVSCFTATAKQKVIVDICNYFDEKLGLKLEVFQADIFRTNLHYKVYESKQEENKYTKTRYLLESHNCPTIIYVSRTRKAYQLAERLRKDGFNAKPYHGKMDKSLKKINQDEFISGDVDIIVATSAFGMGVDKKDVGMVIHHDISDSLENYVQEAGRAGRDKNMTAECFVLFSEEDLNKHFVLLNQTKITIKEIQQIWVAIKKITNFRSKVSNSALEIARKAGWDDSVREIETRVTTAIAALEEAGYLKRGQNSPRIFANSILSKNAQEAIDKINSSPKFIKEQKVKAIRIIKKLFSAKSRKAQNDEVAESRVDYISDHLGIVKGEVISIITLLREENILADSMDLTAFILNSKSKRNSLSLAKDYFQTEEFLLSYIDKQERVLNIKELNEDAFSKGLPAIDTYKIKTILNFWEIKNLIKKHNHSNSSNHISVISLQDRKKLKEKLNVRQSISRFIIDFLYKKISHKPLVKKEILVEFSVLELKDNYKKQLSLFKSKITTDDIEDALFYLSKIGAIKIEGGFLVVYNKLTIDRLEKNNKIQYKKEDYQKLDEFYNSKIQQIHIVGEYAKSMLEDYNKALKFVDDYFKLNYSSFLNKYFPGSRKDEIRKNITPKKFKQLFGTLSPRQLDIIQDKKSKYLLVAAGPGSGKTRVLVHKLASLLLMEDVKHDQLLMLTFSRAAATEFKKRLISLIGNAASFVDIKTFHSYCFDLLGRVGNIEKSQNILKETVDKIESGEVEQNKITKLVLVIDEAQDMDSDESRLIRVLMEKNEELRVITVGDDDQNIYTFRGADSKYFEQFLNFDSSKKYELLENYRSRKNLIDFSNLFVQKITKRLKINPIVSVHKENGVIELHHYKNTNLILPLVDNLFHTEFTGTTAILTKTNDEAQQITGLLNSMGLPAKLIQSNTDFSLYNLIEIRTFMEDISVFNDSPTISKDTWNEAKRNFINKYKKSSNFELVTQIIKDFQEVNPKTRYKSDFEIFVKESKLEDFSKIIGETIFVSTIHKAKGKEFDNVFLLLDNVPVQTDDEKRTIYVAISRAKKFLSIHYNDKIFEDTFVEQLIGSYDESAFETPNRLHVNLTHQDVKLGYFNRVQSRISKLKAGDSLKVNKYGLENSEGDQVLMFSNSFQEKISKLSEKNFTLSKAKINFVLYWSMDDAKEVRIILPLVVFKRDIQ